MSHYRYRKGLTTGPAMRLAWYDYTGTALYQMATGWTFTAKIVKMGTSIVLVTKTAGITGSNTSPNVIVDFESADFSALPGGSGTYYEVIVTATPSGGDPIVFEGDTQLPRFELLAALT